MFNKLLRVNRLLARSFSQIKISTLSFHRPYLHVVRLKLSQLLKDNSYFQGQEPFSQGTAELRKKWQSGTVSDQQFCQFLYLMVLSYQNKEFQFLEMYLEFFKKAKDRSSFQFLILYYNRIDLETRKSQLQVHKKKFQMFGVKNFQMLKNSNILLELPREQLQAMLKSSKLRHKRGDCQSINFLIQVMTQRQILTTNRYSMLNNLQNYILNSKNNKSHSLPILYNMDFIANKLQVSMYFQTNFYIELAKYSGNFISYQDNNQLLYWINKLIKNGKTRIFQVLYQVQLSQRVDLVHLQNILKTLNQLVIRSQNLFFSQKDDFLNMGLCESMPKIENFLNKICIQYFSYELFNFVNKFPLLFYNFKETSQLIDLVMQFKSHFDLKTLNLPFFKSLKLDNQTINLLLKLVAESDLGIHQQLAYLYKIALLKPQLIDRKRVQFLLEQVLKSQKQQLVQLKFESDNRKQYPICLIISYLLDLPKKYSIQILQRYRISLFRHIRALEDDVLLDLTFWAEWFKLQDFQLMKIMVQELFRLRIRVNVQSFQIIQQQVQVSHFIKLMIKAISIQAKKVNSILLIASSKKYSLNSRHLIIIHHFLTAEKSSFSQSELQTICLFIIAHYFSLSKNLTEGLQLLNFNNYNLKIYQTAQINQNFVAQPILRTILFKFLQIPDLFLKNLNQAYQAGLVSLTYSEIMLLGLFNIIQLHNRVPIKQINSEIKKFNLQLSSLLGQKNFFLQQEKQHVRLKVGVTIKKISQPPLNTQDLQKTIFKFQEQNQYRKLFKSIANIITENNIHNYNALLQNLEKFLIPAFKVPAFDIIIKKCQLGNLDFYRYTCCVLIIGKKNTLVLSEESGSIGKLLKMFAEACEVNVVEIDKQATKREIDSLFAKKIT